MGNFIEEIIDADLAAGRETEIVTRFPPERLFAYRARKGYMLKRGYG